MLLRILEGPYIFYVANSQIWLQFLIQLSMIIAMYQHGTTEVVSSYKEA